MQTFSFSKEELRDLSMYDYLLKRYILTVVCKRINLDLVKGDVKFDLLKGELYWTDKPVKPPEQPKPADQPPELKDKSSEGGDKPAK